MNVTETKFIERPFKPYTMYDGKYDKPYADSVVYVNFGESVWEHVNNRRNRPYNILKPIIAAELRKNHIQFDKIRWNRYAGCSMCPCSGGFIIEGFRGHDIWMTVTKD